MPQAAAIVSWFALYGYVIAYPLAIVEGPVVMLLSGFFVRLGIFSFWPIYVILIAGDLTGDVFWYWVGRSGARRVIERYGHFLNLTDENVERAEQFFHDHQGKILFISKITMGFGFALATLVAAGAAKIPFKKYFSINFIGEFVWAGFLVGAGYFLGQLYTLVDRGLRWAFIGAVIVMGIAAAYGFSKFMRKRFNGTMKP